MSSSMMPRGTPRGVAAAPEDRAWVSARPSATHNGEMTRLARLARPFLTTFERVRFKWERELAKNPEQYRSKHPVAPPSEDVIVRFIIPLISRTKSKDWDVVCGNLGRTIDALRRQTSDKWAACIACQTKPPGITFDDKVRFLRHHTAPSPDTFDKQKKIRALIRHMSGADKNDGYIFFLDGDDIPHPRLVEHIVRDNNGSGYYLDKGYLVDFNAKTAVGLGVPPHEERKFHLSNGSTNAIRFDLRHGRAHVIPAVVCGPHMTVKDRLRPFGFTLESVPFPAMLYVFNHGDNLEIHRGRGEFQSRMLKEAGANRGLYESVLKEFGLTL